MKLLLLRPGDEALMQRAEDVFYPGALSAERAAFLLREPTYVMVVALDHTGAVMGRIYGHVLHRFDGTDFLIYEADTAEAHLRQGAASALLDFLKGLAHERGWREMWVLTEVGNAAGNALYRSAGGTLENSPANMYVIQIAKS
ncbi:MAG: GNAT family N-acetyltransferase [Rhizomicrobium sp.]